MRRHGMCFIAWSAQRFVGTKNDDIRIYSSILFTELLAKVIAAFAYALWYAKCNGRLCMPYRMPIWACTQLESANEDQIGRILFIRRKQGDLCHACTSPIPTIRTLAGVRSLKSTIKWTHQIWTEPKSHAVENHFRLDWERCQFELLEPNLGSV